MEVRFDGKEHTEEWARELRQRYAPIASGSAGRCEETSVEFPFLFRAPFLPGRTVTHRHRPCRRSESSSIHPTNVGPVRVNTLRLSIHSSSSRERTAAVCTCAGVRAWVCVCASEEEEERARQMRGRGWSCTLEYRAMRGSNKILITCRKNEVQTSELTSETGAARIGLSHPFAELG